MSLAVVLTPAFLKNEEEKKSKMSKIDIFYKVKKKMTLLELKSRNTDDEKCNYLKERRKNKKYFNTFHITRIAHRSLLFNFVIFTYQNNL